jgi:hypothetical protein
MRHFGRTPACSRYQKVRGSELRSAPVMGPAEDGRISTRRARRHLAHSPRRAHLRAILAT